MPKEYTHWVLAEQSRLSLKEGPLRQVLTDYPGCYLLGAVLPDSPFYMSGQADAAFYINSAEALHGERGEDSYSGIRRFLYHRAGDIQPWEQALIAGMLTHIQADAHFHPLIYYFSGQAPDSRPLWRDSFYRHYCLESALDVWNGNRRGWPVPRTLRRIMRGIPLKKRLLYSTIAQLYWNDAERTGQAEQMLRRHTLLQSLFIRRWAGFAAHLLAGSEKGLFYPVSRKRKYPFFELPVRYRHPLGGEWYQETFSEIEQRCLQSIQLLFSGLKEAFEAGQGFEYFSSLNGPSLSTGRPHTHNQDMKYFSNGTSVHALIHHWKGSPELNA